MENREAGEQGSLQYSLTFVRYTRRMADVYGQLSFINNITSGAAAALLKDGSERQSIDLARMVFAAHSTVHHAWHLMQRIVLGDQTLGQQSPARSDDEAQRIKPITELGMVPPSPSPSGRGARGEGSPTSVASAPASRRSSQIGHYTLYELNEPTVGLQPAKWQSSSTCRTAKGTPATPWW